MMEGPGPGEPSVGLKENRAEPMTTHYDVLGIRANAAPETIKRAYYKRARAYHPDAHAGSTDSVIEEAERAMAALNTAWNTLSDPVLRSEYDRALDEEEQAELMVRGGKRRAAAARKAPPTALLGAGFSYWMGGLGSTARNDGQRRISLSVDGAASFSALRSLAPDRLWALHAQGATIDDDELVNLQGMSDLLVLDLAGTDITDAGLLHLQGLENLEHLSLWNTGITDAGLALVSRLTNLRHLGLGATAISDAGLAHLRTLERLRVLQIWGTRVTGHGLQHLHGLRELEIVSLPARVRSTHRRRLRAALAGALVA